MTNPLARQTVPSEGQLTREGIDITKQQLDMLELMVSTVLVADKDFGVIPGTEKPTLLKPGADNVTAAFRCRARPTLSDKTIDLDNGYISYVFRVELVSLNDGEVKAEGVGECNSYEKKYRYRIGRAKCPSCGSEAIIKGKDEYGGGWLCWKKNDGCGAKFDDDDPEITSQSVGRTINEDPFEQSNTILKMAEKRAYVDAAMKLPGVARFFTQDMEDIAAGGSPEPQPQTTQRETEPKPAPTLTTVPSRLRTPKPATKAASAAAPKTTTGPWDRALALATENNMDAKALNELCFKKYRRSFYELSDAEKKAVINHLEGLPAASDDAPTADDLARAQAEYEAEQEGRLQDETRELLPNGSSAGEEPPK